MIASPILKQNVYNGVYLDLEPHQLPKDLDFFNIDGEKFPLAKEVERYILKARLEKGDCVYIPGRYWFQNKTISKTSFLLQFEYEPSSKLADLIFDRIKHISEKNN